MAWQRRWHAALAGSSEILFYASRIESLHGDWRRVARACLLEGRSIREALRRLGMGDHQVRRHRDALVDACAMVCEGAV
jgi:hypothetical protein